MNTEIKRWTCSNLPGWIRSAEIVRHPDGNFTIIVDSKYGPRSIECFETQLRTRRFFGTTYMPGAKWKLS
jgi:hypothetical protein